MSIVVKEGSYTDDVAREGRFGGIHAPDELVTALRQTLAGAAHIAMEDDLAATEDDVRPTGRQEVGTITRKEEWPLGLCVRARDAGRRGVAGVVHRAGEAVAAVEEEVDALVAAVEAGGFDQGAVVLVSVEDLDRSGRCGGDTVRLHLLKHDGCRHNWLYRVVAVAAVAD